MKNELKIKIADLLEKAILAKGNKELLKTAIGELVPTYRLPEDYNKIN